MPSPTTHPVRLRCCGWWPAIPAPMTTPEAALGYPKTPRRALQIYAVDPRDVCATMVARLAGNETVTITVPYEPLADGPRGELVRVIDYDAATKTFYAPVNLDDPVARAGRPGASERDPRFRQQMVYAVIS